MAVETDSVSGWRCLVTVVSGSSRVALHGLTMWHGFGSGVAGLWAAFIWVRWGVAGVAHNLGPSEGIFFFVVKCYLGGSMSAKIEMLPGIRWSAEAALKSRGLKF